MKASQRVVSRAIASSTDADLGIAVFTRKLHLGISDALARGGVHHMALDRSSPAQGAFLHSRRRTAGGKPKVDAGHNTARCDIQNSGIRHRKCVREEDHTTTRRIFCRRLLSPI